LGNSEMILVCSRRFIAQQGKPLSVDDLGKLPTLCMARPGNKFSWRFTAADGTEFEVQHTPRLATDDLAMLRTAALQGVGIAMLPDCMLRKELADGSLVHVLPELKVPPGVVHVVFASRRGLIPAVRALIDALAAEFEETKVRQ